MDHTVSFHITLINLVAVRAKYYTTNNDTKDVLTDYLV